MEIILICFIAIIFFTIFGILISKLAAKLTLIGDSEKPIPNDLIPASEFEKELFKKEFIIVGTRKDSEYLNKIINKCLDSLHVSLGVIENIEEHTSGVDFHSTSQIVTVRTGDISYQITNILPTKKTYIGCQILSFYSKDNKGKFVFRFANIYNQ